MSFPKRHVFFFSGEPCRIERGELVREESRSEMFGGYPSEEHLRSARAAGRDWRYCNLMYVAEDLSAYCIDHIDLNRYFYSK